MTELSGNAIFMSRADHVRADHEAPDLLRAAGRVGVLADVLIVYDQGRECPVGEHREILVRGDQVLPGYKRPRRWLFVDTIPKNVSGKAPKLTLREQYATD